MERDVDWADEARASKRSNQVPENKPFPTVIPGWAQGYDVEKFEQDASSLP